MNTSQGKMTYSYKQPYTWNITGKSAEGLFSVLQLDEICASCDSIKDKEIGRLKDENHKSKQLNEFYRKELQTLELRTALDAPAVSLQTMVGELTATSEGKAAWEDAWKERQAELQGFVRQGKMSKVKYFRLINNMEQKTLAEELDTAQPNISRIERPGYNVPTKTLKKLATIFGVKMEDLIEG
jgi:DNA-binding XRE family transcriptional regulator